MIEERYFEFFKHSQDDVDFLVNTLLKNEPSHDIEHSLKSFCALKRVDLHELIRENEVNLTDLKYKMFLGGLLAELSASNDFYKTVIGSSNVGDDISSIYILSQFNNKIYSYLKTYYQQTFPDLFFNTSMINEMLNTFEVDHKIEQGNKFKLASLIAEGSLTYDDKYYYYKGQTYEAPTEIAKLENIARNYILHTKQGSNFADSRNIFNIKSLNVLRYLIRKFENKGQDIKPFFMDEFNKISN